MNVSSPATKAVLRHWSRIREGTGGDSVLLTQPAPGSREPSST
ncbi:hypothetical protein ABZU75_40655 [Streptosporangium sp. NPDC005286]